MRAAGGPAPSFDTTWVRQANRASVLRAVDALPRSVTELTRELLLSRSTVESTLRYLDLRGLLERQEAVAEGSGRPPVRYAFRRRCAHAVGVHVGERAVRAMLVDVGRGRSYKQDDRGVSSPWECLVEVAVDAPRAARLSAMASACVNVLATAGLGAEHIDAVVAATPGIIGPDGTVLECGVLKDWRGLPLAAHLRETFPDCRVRVDNDANLAAHGQAHVGEPGRAADLLYVLAGTRIGLGVVLDGQVRHGANHRAGESANVEGSPWHRANVWLREHAEALGLPRGGHRVVTAADMGPLAVHLANGIADAVHLLDPDLVVVGGALTEQADLFLDRVAAELATRCRPQRSAPAIEVSPFGERAVIVGAAVAACGDAREMIFTDLPDRAGYRP